MAQFGNPPKFPPRPVEEPPKEEEKKEEPVKKADGGKKKKDNATGEVPTKFKSKKVRIKICNSLIYFRPNW